MFVSGAPALGYLLNIEGWVGYQIWADEPFVSAILVPQHMFAASCVLATIWVFSQPASFASKVACGALVTSAAALCSLILLPHVSLLFAAVGGIYALAERPVRKSIPIVVLGGLAYAVVILPFLVEAMGWQQGTSGQIVAFPPLDQTIAVVAAAFGPVLLLGMIGLGMLLRKDKRNPLVIAWLSVVGLASILAVTLRYSEAPFKSTLLLRLLLPALAAVSLLHLWKVLPRPGRFGLMIGAVVIVVLNAPIVRSFVEASWHQLGPNDRSVIAALRQSEPPIFLDGADQWIAALAVRSVMMDFRPYRLDAYLPPTEPGNVWQVL